LADRAIAELGADAILFGSPAEAATAERICATMRRPAISPAGGHVVNLAGRTAIGDLPALLAACGLFVGNDSGAMHVAAAVGLPVVGLFGPTDPQGTAPVTPQFTLVRERVSCSPCFLVRCPVDHRCMQRIPVERVFAAVAELSRKCGSASRDLGTGHRSSQLA
jgi:heptosyltransferase-2